MLSRESFTWEYDRWGNLTKETTDDGDARTELVYTYDERGNLLRKWQGIPVLNLPMTSGAI